MKIELHHVNVCSHDVPGLDDFYRKVFDMKTIEDDEHVQDTSHGYNRNVSFLTDGKAEFHLATQDLHVGHRTGHAVNPLERGRLAFRTDDIQAFKKHLDEKGVPYSDYGGWAMSGWHQIFFHDPDGNVIEVHQAPE